MPLSEFILGLGERLQLQNININQVAREEEFTEIVCQILSERTPSAVWVAADRHDNFNSDDCILSGEYRDKFGMKDLSYTLSDPDVPSDIIEIKFERGQTFNLHVQFCHAWNDMIRLGLTKKKLQENCSCFLIAFITHDLFEKTKNGSQNQWSQFFPIDPAIESGDEFDLFLNPTNADDPSNRGSATPWPDFTAQQNITTSHVNYILTGATYTALMGTLERPSYEIHLEIASRAFRIGDVGSPERFYLAAAEIQKLSIIEGDTEYCEIEDVLRFLP